MKLETLNPAEQIVTIMNRIYGYGMTTTSGGNLSIKDENEDVWITPAGIDKGSLTVKDIVQVKPDGTMIGLHKPSCELPFHQSTYNQRPDIKAVVHAHPPALVSFSIVRKIPDTALISNASLISGEVGMAAYGLPGSDDLGEEIASVLRRGINTVLLENHGVVAVGHDLSMAFMAFETLELCARLEINARRVGIPFSPSPEQVNALRDNQFTPMDEFEPIPTGDAEEKMRREMCAFISRSYDRMLITSASGTFSTRLDEHSFMITPQTCDRKYLDTTDIVNIKNGKREAGKIPDQRVLMHKQIYDRHPHIHSIITAQPPDIMAYAVTEVAFASRTIPESYIVLKNINRLPFGSCQRQPGMVAELLTSKNPIVLVENDCLIVTGNSLLNTFDRLEVAEYSARALTASKSLGQVVLINDRQIIEINKAFNLE